MSIFIVRHGETALNRARILQPLDTPLSEAGIQQGRALARRLALLGVQKVISSDLPRARDTAALVLEQVNVQVEYWSELRERSFGALRGLAYAQLTEDISADSFVPPDGESMEQFRSRVSAVWRRLVEERRRLGGSLLVVTHNLVCAAIGREHLHAPAALALPAQFANASLTVAAAEPPHTASVLNCTQHLASS